MIIYRASSLHGEAENMHRACMERDQTLKQIRTLLLLSLEERFAHSCEVVHVVRGDVKALNFVNNNPLFEPLVQLDRVNLVTHDWSSLGGSCWMLTWWQHLPFTSLSLYMRERRGEKEGGERRGRKKGEKEGGERRGEKEGGERRGKEEEEEGCWGGSTIATSLPILKNVLTG